MEEGKIMRVLLFLVILCSFSSVVVLSTPILEVNSNQRLHSGNELKNTKGVSEYSKPMFLDSGRRRGSRPNAVIAPPTDTFALLLNLRKVQGPDGRSPVCKICSGNAVDANTYDYFCLPDSDGMDGITCDKLTILGTTTSYRLSRDCKLIHTRRPIICK